MLLNHENKLNTLRIKISSIAPGANGSICEHKVWDFRHFAIPEDGLNDYLCKPFIQCINSETNKYN